LRAINSLFGGKTLISHGHLKNLDETQLAKNIQDIAEKFWEIIPETDFAMRIIDKLAPLSLPLWKP